MEGRKNKMKIFSIFAIITFAVVLRLIPHPPNFTPIGALAIFGGAYFGKKYGILLPLLVMLISDLFIGIHSTIGFVYAGFLIAGLIGNWIGKNRNFSRFFIGTLASSVLFFTVSNFGVWAATPLYPKTLEGLVLSYVMAIPFFRNTILSDIFYVSLFISSYEFALIKLTSKTALLFYDKNLHQKRR